jgi:hypothetical protein
MFAPRVFFCQKNQKCRFGKKIVNFLLTDLPQINIIGSVRNAGFFTKAPFGTKEHESKNAENPQKKGT